MSLSQIGNGKLVGVVQSPEIKWHFAVWMAHSAALL
jgi:hypothetical protein